MTYVIEAHSDVATFTLITIVIAGGAWVLSRNLLCVHPLCWVLLVICGFIYLRMPRVMFATHMVDQRLPVAFVFMIIACVDINLRRRDVRWGFVAFLIIVLLVRVTEFDVSWAGLSGTTSEFRASVKRIKQGSKVLVAYAESNVGQNLYELLVHAACIAMIERPLGDNYVHRRGQADPPCS